LGFGVWGLGFGAWGLGFGVWGLGFGVWGLGFRVPHLPRGAPEQRGARHSPQRVRDLDVSEAFHPQVLRKPTGAKKKAIYSTKPSNDDQV